MVTGTLQGYLGNQMFIMAAIVGYAVKHNMAYIIPGRSSAPDTFPCYFPHLAGLDHQNPGVFYHYKETSFAYQEIPEYPFIHLNGLFQSEKYFAHCKKRIKNLFFDPPATKENAVAVCVRRGDYLKYPDRHPVVTEQYLLESIEKFVQLGCRHFTFYSNDQAWCQDFITRQLAMKYIDDVVFFLVDQTSDPLEKMKLAASCQHTIMSNSTFDWWVHYLNPSPDKLVIVPPVWFGPEYQRSDLPYAYDGRAAWLDTSDLIPGDWKRV